MKNLKPRLATVVLCGLTALTACGHRPAATVSVADLQITNPPASAALTRFAMRVGTKVRIEGTANMIHTRWLVESPLIGGYLEAGPGFPTEPGQLVNLGKVEAHADIFIPVRALRSVEDNGQLYSDAMDDVMYAHLKAKDDPKAKITYHLVDLTLKELAKAKDAPYSFEARGELVVAGVTNQITTPVSVLLLGDGTLRISGTNSVKMTDFKIEPPAPKLALGALKTGDQVKLIFQWIVAPRTNAAPASTK